MGRTVLITGVSGFVGMPLSEEMVRHGWRVKAAMRSLGRLSAEIETVAVGEIDSETDWADALCDVDVVIHLAARVHQMRDKSADPLKEFRRVNVDGTERLARVAAARGVKRMVFLSTIKVNGECTNTSRHSSEGQKEAKSYTESDIPDPQDPYAISKWEAEQVLHRVTRETGLEVVIIRSPLVYGPGVQANFRNLMRFVERGIPLPLGAIYNSRSLIYIGNLVDAIVKCTEPPEAAGETFLVSDGQAVSTCELVRCLARAMGRSARIFPFPVAALNVFGMLTGKSTAIERLVESLVVDDTKIRRKLGWMPPYSMEQGLRATVK